MEFITDFFIYIIFILFIIFGYYRFRVKASALMNLYQKQAARRNATIQRGFLSNPRLNLMDEGKTISIYEVSGSKNSPPRTEMKRELELGDSMKIIIVRENEISKIGKIFGLQDFRVGNPQFDDFFLIRGSDELMVQSFLSPDIQDHILRLRKSNPRVRIEKNLFVFTISGHLEEDAEYDQFIEAGLAMIGKAKMLCRDKGITEAQQGT